MSEASLEMSKDEHTVRHNNNHNSNVIAETNVGTKRDRWANRVAFILACIGSAVGIGNFWRFPYLTYKHGGAIFFIPYLFALFFFGIPMMIFELGVG